jgi:mutator protein MutT
VVLDEEGRVLLVKRANEPLKGEWSVPGGAVELGETVADAVRREIREESGIEVKVGPILEVLDRISYDDDGRVRFHYVLVDFLCLPIGGAVACATDADAAAWTDYADLRRLGVAETTIGVIDKGILRRSALD